MADTLFQALEALRQRGASAERLGPAQHARAIAHRLLLLGAACTDAAGALSYAACCCDEAATCLEDQPPRVDTALAAVQFGLAHVGLDPAGLVARELAPDLAPELAPELVLLRNPEVVLLQAAELILRREVTQ